MEINDFLPSRAHNKTGYFDELIRIENKAINSLRLKGRTTSQIAYVRKLIVELIEIYFDEENKIAIVKGLDNIPTKDNFSFDTTVREINIDQFIEYIDREEERKYLPE